MHFLCSRPRHALSKEHWRCGSPVCLLISAAGSNGVLTLYRAQRNSNTCGGAFAYRLRQRVLVFFVLFHAGCWHDLCHFRMHMRIFCRVGGGSLAHRCGQVGVLVSDAYDHRVVMCCAFVEVTYVTIYHAMSFNCRCCSFRFYVC
ncbi:T. brucei spp.-specific protein [Trypanosoma brucei gambiense DAL972]|uniref:T. brucei spp.-specific protein n=1 Tax=Trypanosoma brucei gambiense (strain MHOM/CI/86/DAL972) TaxID=679716 RepID=C9ZLU0_TRYB9|nr:T. brucei spp.-specific protein [Trypanosoma brucei gambiense DAL972]CBH10365.1 T. brucei spp.-specific protein [Trypanosoma brucei gambiense DAL972]|eukprot:XP_011772655.1 T. brucei spp.-specific protein [Trypanosoma brucei gambiense DAL972]